MQGAVRRGPIGYGLKAAPLHRHIHAPRMPREAQGQCPCAPCFLVPIDEVVFQRNGDLGETPLLGRSGFSLERSPQVFSTLLKCYSTRREGAERGDEESPTPNAEGRHRPPPTLRRWRQGLCTTGAAAPHPEPPNGGEARRSPGRPKGTLGTDTPPRKAPEGGGAFPAVCCPESPRGRAAPFGGCGLGARRIPRASDGRSGLRAASPASRAAMRTCDVPLAP